MIIMVSEWVSCMDKRPSERSETDLEIIQDRLRHIKAFERLHPSLLQQICYYGYYEDLERGVTLFRQGDRGNNWYAVLTGSLDVQVLAAQHHHRPTINESFSSGPGPPNAPSRVNDAAKSKIVKPNQAHQESVTLCTLGIGTAFGESVLESEPHQATVVTNEHCELLRIEQRDFQELWERNRHLMEDIISPLSHVRTSSSSNNTNNIPPTFVELSSAGLTSNGSLSLHRRSVAGLPGQSPHHQIHSLANSHGGDASPHRSASLPQSPLPPSVALLDKRIEMQKAAVVGPRTGQRLQQHPLKTPRAELQVEPSEQAARAGWVLRTLMLANNPQLIRDRKYHVKMFKRCMVGSEMVDWLLALGGGAGSGGNGSSRVRVHSRTQAIGMWQALLEEGVILHVLGDHQFKDKYLFYRFRRDDAAIGGDLISTPPTSPLLQSQSSSAMIPPPTPEERQRSELELQDVLASLVQMAPDAVFRMILRKPPVDRVVEDLEIIYEELLHIKALSHLSNSVKRELAGVLVFESHPKAGTVLFNQGDEGKSWYIILRGSVDVVIYGKGVVCSLHDGDDFGKLALVNDAPRAATIVTREDGCHLLRVDKDDFNRILRDVEANTVRLKEHGQDVLLLQKIPTDNRTNTTPLTQGNSPAHRTTHSHYKYMVMAGTPQKMLEHLLETRIDTRSDDVTDTFLEDFLMTHVIFMPSHQLCPELMKHYRIDASNCRQEIEFVIASKRRVVHFIRVWAHLIREAFFEDSIVLNFLEELLTGVKEDSRRYSGYLGEELKVMTRIVDVARNMAAERDSAVPQKWKVSPSGQIIRLTTGSSLDEDRARPELSTNRPIKPTDEIVFRVHCADHTYTTLKATIGATAEAVKRIAAEKLGLKDELVLVEVKSSGERFTCKDTEVSVPTGLTVNGRLFITPIDHIDALTPLPEQEGPLEGTGSILEGLASHDIAYYMTRYEWDLFNAVHEYELIYQVFGRHQFRRIMANLDVFLRRFNEVQFWVVTEMCLATSLNRRVTLLRKFIKIAALCREYQNMNSFFAIVMGLSNVAVSRLSQTWERLPGKLKRAFAEFETLIDPSRNHRRYRLAVAKMSPPIIPFMPLLLKDMTFSHEGNKTYLEGLVNFEKMHMIAQTLRTLSHCRSQPLEPPSTAPSSKTYQVKEYIRSLRVIDNQRRLTQLSHALEPRRT